MPKRPRSRPRPAAKKTRRRPGAPPVARPPVGPTFAAPPGEGDEEREPVSRAPAPAAATAPAAARFFRPQGEAAAAALRAARHDYRYVRNEIRRIAFITAAVVVLLVVLAFII